MSSSFFFILTSGFLMMEKVDLGLGQRNFKGFPVNLPWNLQRKRGGGRQANGRPRRSQPPSG
jgi:hypothetical protein